jgi:hypothetical protein
MLARLAQLATVLGATIIGCGFPAPAPPISTHPVASRTGPACDSIISRLASPDHGLTVQGPFPTKVALLPEDRPSDMTRKFSIRFMVDQSGQAVVDTLSLPTTRSRRYRASMLERLRQFTFDPAIVGGCAVPAVLEMRIELA